MAQITQTVAQGILDGQGYTANEVRQLAHFWLSASTPAGSVTAPARGPTESLVEWALRATPEDLNTANWGVVRQGLLRARDELEKTGVVHSWIGPYIDIARQESQRTPPAQAADSVQEDAARYRWLRDGDWREHEKLESVIRLQLNALWDKTIDAARKQGEKQ